VEHGTPRTLPVVMSIVFYNGFSGLKQSYLQEMSGSSEWMVVWWSSIYDISEVDKVGEDLTKV